MFMDLALARRVERAEGTIGTSFTEVRQRVMPTVGALWRDFGGTYAIYDGVDSPMTQTFGLGMFEPATPDLLAVIEAFFNERGAVPMHEVSPFAGVETFALLAERGYRPMELSTVLVQPIEARPAATSDLHVRRIERADHPAWIETAVRGWGEDPVIARVIRELTEVAVENLAMTHFIVERAGVPIATGSLGLHEGIALLAGASTIPDGRGLGAQGLLLASRLAEAHARGCDTALMVSAPGSTSQRNAERRGFRVAYTRTKWRLAPVEHAR
ncbi:MAG: hypothetical protein ABI867_19560 [Kofleriaceae bacterium]